MGEQKTLLLVEDELIIALGEAQMLERHGYTVIPAVNGQEAIATARSTAIDLILMDVDLGQGPNGAEVAEVILRERDIPVVFLSSHVDPATVERTERITSYGYVVKSSDDTVLVASIKMAFKLHEAHSEIRRQKEEIEAANARLRASVRKLEVMNEELNTSRNDLLERERELQRRNRYIETILEKAPIGFAVRRHSDSKVLFVNEMYAHVYGIPRHSFSTVDEFFEKAFPDPAFRAQLRQQARAVIDSRDPARMRFPNLSITTPSGERKVVSAMTIPLLEQDLLISTVQDVTDRFRAQESLQENQHLLQTIIDNAEWLIYAFDRQSRLKVCNRKFAALFDSTPDALTGKKRNEFLSPDIAQEHETIDQIVFETRQPFSTEEHNRESDGIHTYLTMKFPLFDATGELDTVVGISSDITERKRAESALQAALEEKEALLRELRHRVVNSLNLIGGLIRLESEHLTGQKVEDTLDRLAARVASIARLYSMLGRVGGLENIRLDQYLHEIISFLRASYLTDGAEITIRTALEEMVVAAKQAASIGLILNELVTNAIKHAFPEHCRGTVMVSARRANGAIVIEVIDDGRGIPEGATNKAGLGMDIVRMLLSQLSGSMEQERTEKTLVRLRIPAA